MLLLLLAEDAGPRPPLWARPRWVAGLPRPATPRSGYVGDLVRGPCLLVSATSMIITLIVQMALAMCPGIGPAAALRGVNGTVLLARGS